MPRHQQDPDLIAELAKPVDAGTPSEQATLPSYDIVSSEGETEHDENDGEFHNGSDGNFEKPREPEGNNEKPEKPTELEEFKEPASNTVQVQKLAGDNLEPREFDELEELKESVGSTRWSRWRAQSGAV